MAAKKRIIFPKNLPEGITVNALEAVAKLVKSGRQVFGVPGASLTWGIEGSESNDVRAGIEGEKMTGRLLSAWVEKNPGVLVFHSVRWPGSDGDTDHIIVIGRTVLLVDSKRWKSKRKYSVTAKGSIKRGTVDFPEGNVKMLPAMSTWRNVLGKGVRVQGAVCIAQDEVFVPYDENWRKAPYKLVTAEKLEEYLDRFMKNHVREDDRNLVDLSLVTNIATRLVKPRDRRSEVINMRAVRSLRAQR